MSLDTGALSDLRAEIDEIDATLHALIMRRAEIGLRIAATKRNAPETRGHAIPVFRPGREAAVLRKLIASHSGPFPVPALMQIWRGIISGMTQLQTRFSVGVVASAYEGDVTTAARDHFGLVTEVEPFPTLEKLADAIHRGSVSVGVLPWVARKGALPWWALLAGADPSRRSDTSLSLVARLPFARFHPHAAADAAVLAPFRADPSGDDSGCFVLSADTPSSQVGLLERIKRDGSLSLAAECAERGRMLYLIERHETSDLESDRPMDPTEWVGIDSIVSIGRYARPTIVDLGEHPTRNSKPASSWTAR